MNIIYTTLIGNYKLKEIRFNNPNWKYICFSDRFHKSDVWEIKIVKIKDSPRRTARDIKINYFKYINAKISLYIDSKFTINEDPQKFIDENLNDNILIMDHNKRNCLYKEAEFCIENNIGNEKNIKKQVDFYKKYNYPDCNGLYGTGILVRKHTPEVEHLMKLWWKQIIKFSSRDQISFPYVLWKLSKYINVVNFRETYERFK